MIVSVKNERNLASLTVYGDIEGQESTNAEQNSNEMYITPGVVNIFFTCFSCLLNLIESIRLYFKVSLSWKDEGAKRVQFRADYRRVVNGEMSEYRTVYVDVVYVKTDLPLKFIHFSPDNRNGHFYQNFTVQTYGNKRLTICYVL